MMKSSALYRKISSVGLVLMILCISIGAMIDSNAAYAATPGSTIISPDDGGPATDAKLKMPFGVAVDQYGNIYIADRLGRCIRKVDTSGIITTVAGDGTKGYAGDGGPATSAELTGPDSVAVDASGNIYIADTFNNRIRRVDTNGIITTVAGDGYTTAINTNSRVYLPARYVAEALGFNVYWLANIHAVIVSPYAMPIQENDGSQASPEQGSSTAQAEPVAMPSNPKTGLHLILAIDASSQNDITPLKIQQVIDILKNRAEGLGVVSPVVHQQSDGSISVDLPGLQDPAIANLIIKPSNLEIKNEAGDTVLSSADLEDAQAQLTPNTNQPELELTFDQNLLQQVTAANVGRVLPIYIDGILITSPVVEEVISDGTAAISGRSMTLQDAQQEACLLRSGVLPLSLNVISVTTSTY